VWGGVGLRVISRARALTHIRLQARAHALEHTRMRARACKEKIARGTGRGLTGWRPDAWERTYGCNPRATTGAISGFDLRVPHERRFCLPASPESRTSKPLRMLAQNSDGAGRSTQRQPAPTSHPFHINHTFPSQPHPPITQTTQATQPNHTKAIMATCEVPTWQREHG